MPLNSSEIYNIITTKSAIKDRLYTGDDGTVYKGDKSGNLIVFKKASEVSMEKSNVQELLNNEIEDKGITQEQISAMIQFRL